MKPLLQLALFFLISSFFHCGSKGDKNEKNIEITDSIETTSESIEIKTPPVDTPNAPIDSSKYHHDPKDSLLLHVKVLEYNNEDNQRTYDTAVSREWAKENIYAILDFNYLKLKRRRKGPNTLMLFNDSIVITLRKSKFDSSKHVVIGERYQIGTIDGRDVWGTDGELPHEQLIGFTITIDSQDITIPDSLFLDLYEPHFNCHNDTICNAKAYIDQYNRIIIWMLNSDGAGGYFVIWIISIC